MVRIRLADAMSTISPPTTIITAQRDGWDQLTSRWLVRLLYRSRSKAAFQDAARISLSSVLAPGRPAA